MLNRRPTELDVKVKEAVFDLRSLNSFEFEASYHLESIKSKEVSKLNINAEEDVTPKQKP